MQINHIIFDIALCMLPWLLTQCASGFYTTTEMSTSCTECPANSRCPNKDAEPIACEGGFVSILNE